MLPVGSDVFAVDWVSGTGSWTTASNWSGSSLPTDSTDAEINNGGVAVLTVGDSGEADSVNLGLGAGASGHLVISGGSLLSDGASIGASSTGTGTVSVTSGSWISSNTFLVGENGQGTLSISGGVVSANAPVELGFQSAGNGVVNVSGGTFSALHNTFIIGRRGAGTLNISGGLVTAVQRVTVANVADSNGQVVLGGGVLSANQILEGSGTGTITFNSGTLRASGNQGDFLSGFEDGDVTIDAGGAFIDSNGASIGISTALSGTGGLTKIGLGTLTLSGSNSHNGGTTVSEGTLVVAADNALGDPAFQTAATATGSSSVLQINSGVALGKGIRVENGALVDNRGTITTLNPSAFGIWSSSGNGARVVNTGTITAAATDAIYVQGGLASVTNTGGLIDAQNGNGAWLRGGGTVINESGGMIAGSASWDGVWIEGAAGSVENRTGGTIQGYFNGVTLVEGGTLTNTGSSTIQTLGGAGQNGVQVSSAAGVILNEAGSTIQGRLRGAYLLSGGSVTNFGIITGSEAGAGNAGVRFDASGTLANSGTINGGVLMGNFANSATLNIGSVINGGLSMGASTASQLVLAGTGSQAFSAAVTGATAFSGTLLKQNAGTWTLDRDLTSAASAIVEAGRLNVTSTLSGNAAVLSGASLGGSGLLTGTVSVQNGGILSPGTSPGTLNVGSLDLNAGSILDFELGTPDVSGVGINDLVVVGADLDLDGILNITDIGGFGVGTYYLFEYGGSLTDSGLTFGMVSGAFDLTVDTATPGQVNLLVAAAAAQYWDGPNAAPSGVPGGSGGDGVWNNDGANTNWTNTDGNVNSAWTGVLPAIFGGTAGTVNVDAVVDVAEMRFLTDGYVLNGSGELAISGTTLTIQPDVGVGVDIQTVITGTGGLEKTGAGTVLLSGMNTYEGGTQLNAGTLRIGDDSALGTGALTINGGTLGNDGIGGFPIVTNDIVTNADFTIAVDDFFGGLELEGGLALGTGTRTITFSGEGLVCLGGVISGENLTLVSDDFLADVQFCGPDSNTFNGTLRVGDGVQVRLAKDPGSTAVAGNLVIDMFGAVGLDGDGQLAATSNVHVDGGLDLFFATDMAINELTGSGLILGALLDATLTVNSGNFSGILVENAGVQALVKAGAGTLVMSGFSAYTGGTTINAGTLQTLNQFVLAGGPVTLNGGSLAPVAQIDIATLTWNGGTIAAVVGTTTSFVNISGNLVLGPGGGGFVFSEGAGFVANTVYNILSAANMGTFTTANFFGNALSGVTPIFSINGTMLGVSFIGGSTGGTLSNYAPAFTPTNANFFVNGQVQTSNAPNTVAALTFANGSFLEVFNNLFVTNGNFIVNSGSSTIGGTGNVIAPGAFTKFGGGLLNILTNLFVGGDATIAGGGLAVNGTLTANNLFVQLGTWLQGNGIIFGNVFNSGTVAPGNSPGTLTIVGNFTQSSSGVLEIELGSLSNFDRLLVTGNASLGGTLDVESFAGFEPEYGQQFAFLQAGSISGSFDTITTWDPAAYRARFLTEGGTGSILIAPASYTLVAETTNQRNVAAALDGFIPATSGDRLTVSLALDVQSANQYPAAFDQIAPTFYESLANITMEQANAQSQMLAQRMSAVKLGAAGFQAYGMESPLVHDIDGKSVLESKDIVPQSAVHDPKWSTWVQGNGIFAKVVNVSQVPGYRVQSGGFLFGVDYAWGSRGKEGPALTTGVFAGYQGTYSKYSGGGSNTINSALFGGYASFQNGGFYADAIIGGGYSNYNVRRPIAFSTIDRTATSKPDGGQFSTYLDFGYDWKAGGFTFGPLISSQYTYAGIAPFTEDGAGSLNLAVDQQNVNSLRTNIGGRIAYTWNVTDKIVIVPEVRMFWQHEFLNNPRNIGASLDGGSGAGFGYETSTPDRDSIFAGGGISAQFGERWSGYVYYNADFGRQDYIGQMISTGLNWKF